MIKGNLKLLGFLLFTVQLIVLLLAYSCTIRFASGSKMYCTSKSPRLLVPRSLRILVTVITSSVVFLSGRVYKMSASVKEVCKSQETNFIFHKKKKKIFTDIVKTHFSCRCQMVKYLVFRRNTVHGSGIIWRESILVVLREICWRMRDTTCVDDGCEHHD